MPNGISPGVEWSSLGCSRLLAQVTYVTLEMISLSYYVSYTSYILHYLYSIIIAQKALSFVKKSRKIYGFTEHHDVHYTIWV